MYDLQKQQSLFLLDKGRISVLYIPSGKTKKKIPVLSDIIASAVGVSVTNNGQFLSCYMFLLLFLGIPFYLNGIFYKVCDQFSLLC